MEIEYKDDTGEWAPHEWWSRFLYSPVKDTVGEGGKLAEYNARIIRQPSGPIVIEFDTVKDATLFMLKWF